MKIQQPTPLNPSSKTSRRAPAVDASAPTKREKLDVPEPPPFVERRKKDSDRRAKKDARGPFDSRSGRDRRKNSRRHPSIDVDA